MKYLPQTPIGFHKNNSITKQTMDVFFQNHNDGRAL